MGGSLSGIQWGGEMTQNYGAERKKEPDRRNVRRNPYLVDYEEQRRLREQKAAGRTIYSPRTETARGQERQRRREETVCGRRPESGGRKQADTRPNRRAEALRRRKRAYRQRLAICIFALCTVTVLCLTLLKQKGAEAGNHGNGRAGGTFVEVQQPQTDAGFIQGLPAVEFAKHPVWTEDFLTPNEYSRPGEPLPEVMNIFVHYTANPGTSAAQNRSYFEQQKDMHEASVSAHFIIGYEGEIIQCVPLDEIAYAVQTRNYDSVSIECCYKEKDGSFTQETYDSLIALLVWLTDIYDLDTDDILRHYDCGGKKCPLYYTEHPDAWERLKEDVAEARETKV